MSVTTSPAVDKADLGHITFPPDQVDAAWVLRVTESLLDATQGGIKAAQEVLPYTVAQRILEALYDLLKHEPTVVDVAPATPEIPVVVVGDTHGQLHDVCSMIQKVGHPSDQQLFVFNGDFVDRGAWGLEVLILLACWKLAHPKQVVILRGNHECTTCTHMYGFRSEVLAKYGPKHFKDVFKICKKVFAALPLAAVVGGQTLVLHGGLFRKPAQSTHRRKKRRKTLPGDVLSIGSLQDLRAAGKGGLDPNGAGKSVIATDVLWSDPAPGPGLVENEARGVGLLFGPDVTQAFLEANKLKLILRSHEGPDARWKREGMQDMATGHSLDHDTPEGKLMTVFSAPDYPQFQPNNEDRFNNLGAVAVLRGSQGNYASPEMVEYPAAPRPQAQAFYEYEDVPDSDEEMSIGHGSASDMSAASSQAGSLASHASSAGDMHAEVLSKGPATEGVSPARADGADNNGAVETSAGADAADGFAVAVTTNSNAAEEQVAGGRTPNSGVKVQWQAEQTASAVSTDSLSRQEQQTVQLANGASQHSAAAAQDSMGPAATRLASDTHTSLKPADDMPHGSHVAVLLHGDRATSADGPQAAEHDMATAGSHKRKAATVFDQGIADEAEAADLDAGIAAADAEIVDASTQPTMQSEVANEAQQTGLASAIAEAASNGQFASLPFKRQVQPRPAPWR